MVGFQPHPLPAAVLTLLISVMFSKIVGNQWLSRSVSKQVDRFYLRAHISIQKFNYSLDFAMKCCFGTVNPSSKNLQGPFKGPSNCGLCRRVILVRRCFSTAEVDNKPTYCGLYRYVGMRVIFNSGYTVVFFPFFSKQTAWLGHLMTRASQGHTGDQ